MTDGSGSITSRPFVPLLLLALGVLGWSAFQTYELVAERTSLKAVLANQSAQVDQSQKLRASLDRIASKTAKLAAAGNGDAAAIVEALRKRGVTINPDAGGAAPR
jgi:hypothetical protein